MLYSVLETSKNITDSVLVGFSGGKDSAVTLDLCFRYFKNVQPYFMYIVQGLEFQEITLRYYEKRYNTKIMRVPHFMLSDFLRAGSFRMPDDNVPKIKTADLYAYLRKKSDIHWIAAGERIADSIVRRAMIKNTSAIDPKRGRIYPIAYWNKAQVMAYLKLYKLPLSLENKALGFSFRSLQGRDLLKIKRIFSDDYKRICSAFPLVEAEIKRGEFFGNVQNAEN